MLAVQSDLAGAQEALEQDGYITLPGVYSSAEMETVRASIAATLARVDSGDPAIRGGEGTVYAARNILRLWPGVLALWQQPPLADVLRDVLGPQLGLVRVLYFDKPPGNTWALPWHKDLTIAVRNNRLPSRRFSHPTTKAGVPHVEAPEEVLSEMLTARIHLDAVTDENGPMRVVPGSHRTGKTMCLEDVPVRTLHAGVGDVLLIRPLVAHCSNRSADSTSRHRRILHLEFAGRRELPDGYAWHDFRGPGIAHATEGDPARQQV